MEALPILIIGKHGKTGSRVNRILQDLGYATRGVSRSTAPAFDWDNENTWQTAITGTKTAYVTFQPDLAVPGANETFDRFIGTAKAEGLEHIVLLSGRGEPGAEAAERILIECGISWNVIRASWFNQNFSESFMLEGILAGHLMLPADNTLEPFIDIDDIAEVAVAALTRPELKNRVFEVTGPEAITLDECMRKISAVIGREVKFTTVPIDAYIDEINKQGLPPEMQWLLRELFTVVFDGRNSNVVHGVEEALGRPATSFDTWVRKTAATGVWNAAREQQFA